MSSTTDLSEVCNFFYFFNLCVMKISHESFSLPHYVKVTENASVPTPLWDRLAILKSSSVFCLICWSVLHILKLSRLLHSEPFHKTLCFFRLFTVLQ